MCKTKKNDNDKEVDTMAILTKPLNLSFELNPKKVDKFLRKSNNSALDRAIARASQHQPKVKK